LEFHHQIWLGYDVGKFPWVTMLVNSTPTAKILPYQQNYWSKCKSKDWMFCHS
jgi:hypothetical protein